ncbi:response regulator transcription factor [Corynebacterium callunae]|uniref:response regulator transcription factor n=1 Tax=Corynebacterium callunae TaxID=1721 RepID=UPI0039828F03
MIEQQQATIKVVVVDDEAFFRDSLASAVLKSKRIKVVKLLGDGLQALEFLESNNVDVVLCDVRMPIMDGVELTQEVSARGLNAKVIAVTSFNNDQAMLKMLHAGAYGFLLKSAPRAEIFHAIISVAAGGTVISPVMASSLRKYLILPINILAAELNDRERSVLTLLHQGKSNREIADALGVSEISVKKTMSCLMQIFDVSSRVKLIIATR